MEATIKLKVKDVEIELSIDEAKELKNLLEGLTGVEIREIIRESSPVIIRERWYPWWNETYPKITWQWKDTTSHPNCYHAQISDNITVSYSVT